MTPQGPFTMIEIEWPLNALLLWLKYNDPPPPTHKAILLWLKYNDPTMPFTMIEIEWPHNAILLRLIYNDPTPHKALY